MPEIPKKTKLNLFQLNPDRVPELSALSGDDFAPASQDEKASMVQMHKSVSYWRDALRRFMANHVSVGALIVFCAIFLFTFLGPAFLSYNYADQYRSSIKLGPGESSAAEQTARIALEYADLIYDTSLQPGSLTSLNRKTNYTFTYKGVTYNFYNEKAEQNIIILFSADAEDKLLVFPEGDALKQMFDQTLVDGMKTSVIRGDALATFESLLAESRPIEYRIGEASEDAVKLPLISSVCPHVFGTDSAGRDLMARCMYGGRISIIIGIVAALIVLLIGSIYGAISGLAGGKTDFIMMRVVDIIYSVPDVLIVLLLQVVLKKPLQDWLDASSSAFARSMSDLGVGIISIFITFACLYWVSMARIVRGQVLQLKQQEFVTAANVLGVPTRKIISRHLLPNCVGQLVIATCLQIPSAIFLESFLSFLGLGVSIPMTSLGSLCSDALETITLYPYRLLFPGVILTLLVLSLNLIGDGLRDALDPRLKR